MIHMQNNHMNSEKHYKLVIVWNWELCWNDNSIDAIVMITVISYEISENWLWEHK